MSVTISGSGQIIKQVIQTVKSDIFTASGSSAWTNITGLSASITPTNASNKILVILSVGMVAGNNDIGLCVARNGTPIFIGDAAGTRTRVTMGNFYQTGDGLPAHSTYLDSPATTSAVTYQAQAWILSGAYFCMNEQESDADYIYRLRAASSITLMEVAYA